MRLNLFFAPLWVFSFGIVDSPLSFYKSALLFVFSLGGEEHKHEPALQLGVLFHVGYFRTALSELHQKLLTDVGVRHLAAAEAHADLHAVALFEELDGVFHFGVQIVGVNTGGHTDLLDLHHALVFAGFLFFLHLIEAEFAIVHDLADRGHGVGRDLDQIEILLGCQLQRSLAGHDAQLGAIRTDDTEFLVLDIFVELMGKLSDEKHLQKKQQKRMPTAPAQKAAKRPLADQC